MTRRDFPCPGDGGPRYPARRSGWSIVAGTAVLIAAAALIVLTLAKVAL